LHPIDAEPTVGDLTVVVLETADEPFAVARILEVRKDDSVVCQWFGNTKGSIDGPWLPGWLSNRAKKRNSKAKVQHYWSKTKDASRDKPYTSTTSKTRLTIENLQCSGLTLTDGDLAKPILDLLAAHPKVLWSGKPSRK